MATPQGDPAISQRVSRYRKRMRAQGMRPIQLWVAMSVHPVSSRSAHRQSAAVTASEYATDDQAFIDALGLDEK